jgi:hypothetical protein
MCKPINLSAKLCGLLSPPENGTLSDNVTHVGNWVYARCLEGFWFEPFVFEKALLCTAATQWNDTLAQCQRK